MPGGKGNIKPEDGKQFSSEYQVEYWDEKTALKFGNDLLEWLKEKDENVFFDEFIYLVADSKNYHPKAKIYPELISYLKNKFTSFLKLHSLAEKLQETKLVKFGCFDKLNSSMTKFTLINNHDWKEKSDVTTDGGKINTNINIDSKLIKHINKELEDEY